MVKTTVKVSDSFTVEDIRKLRDDFDKRHTDANGKIDWDGAAIEIEKGAASVRAEIARIRSELNLNVK
jgi:hypothetical protein